MKTKIFFVGIILMVFSCKSKKVTHMEPCLVIRYQLKHKIDQYIMNGRIAQNPLILKDGESYKLYNEIDSLELDTTFVQISNHSFVPKNSQYFISLFGENAKDGVVALETKMKKNYVSDETILLVNGIETNRKELRKIERRNTLKIQYSVPNIRINEEKSINVLAFYLLEKQ